jgi:hypothetical protein
MGTSRFLRSEELYATVKVHLQAIGLEIEKGYNCTEGTETTLREWRYGKFKLRVLAGMINASPIELGILIQSPSGNHLVAKIFKEDYDSLLRYYFHEKQGTAWQTPQANSFMDAALMMHKMGEVGDAYVREHVIPNLGK